MWTSNQIYNYTTSEALMLNIDPSLIVNEVTLNTPRTGVIGTSTNIFTYRLFSGLLTASYFCNTTPTTPTLSQEWNGVAGVRNYIIEVTTTTNGPNYANIPLSLKKSNIKEITVFTVIVSLMSPY
jgi:hypothetical protein